MKLMTRLCALLALASLALAPQASAADRKPLVSVSGQIKQLPSGDMLLVTDDAYDATGWNGSTQVPTKNAVRDKIEALGGGYTDEQARDAIGTALVAGTNVTITVNDGADTITIDSSGGGGYTAENARDDIGTALVAGTGAKITVNDGADTITIAASPSALFEDQKAANTAGGASTSGSWIARTLNTEVYDDIGLTLSSNQISLAAGTYEVDASSMFFSGNIARIRIRDVTNSVTLALSENVYGSSANAGHAAPRILARFTLAGSATIQLEYRVNTSQATNGLGVVSNFGELEIYSRMKLTKII